MVIFLQRLVKLQWHSQYAKSYAQKREIIGSSSDSLRLRPFLKWELLIKERICSQKKEFAPKGSKFSKGSKFFPLRAVPYGMENRFYHIR